MIAEAIFNSLLRYGVAVFLKPVYDEEDLNRRKLPQNTNVLQTLQWKQWKQYDLSNIWS